MGGAIPERWDRTVAMGDASWMDHVNTPTALGVTLRERRRDLGLTQDDLALAIGVNRKVVGQLEGGKRGVRLEIALNAANALGLNIGVEARGGSGA